MNLTKSKATDFGLSENGAWMNLGGDSRIKVARHNNKKFMHRMKSIDQQYIAEKYAEGLTLADPEMEDYANVIADTLIRGWEDLQIDDDDKAFPYNKENSRKLISNRDFQAFVGEILTFANKIENYRKSKIRNDLKNLEPTSPGK